MENNFIFALSLTVFSGICTSIGGVLAFFIKRNNMNIMALGLGFSAGIMIYVSLVEINAKAAESLKSYLGDIQGEWITVGFFLAGILLAAGVDKLLPEKINQDQMVIDSGEKLQRMGIFIAIAIAIHNFPEGLATFMAGLSDLTLGFSIAFAIAIHNIPEGIAVALPIYNATNSRKKAFMTATFSGLAEPLGAIIGYLLLRELFNDLTFGILFALVAGIMIYISFDELLPMAKEYGNGHTEIIGVTAGMLIMWISLILF